MLTKNVYLLYPPGYSGSYVNWAINIADQDLHKTTVPDPLNKNSSRALGGKGTAHVHQRIPTHQNYAQHLAWVIHNRPSDAKVYVINQHDTDLEQNICHIFSYDPTGVVIRIHDCNDKNIRAYGTINMITKWPTFIAAYKKWADHQIDFDPFDCANDLNFRNYTVLQTWCRGTPIDFEILNQMIHRHQDWYTVRHENQPHEVLDQHYVTTINYSNRLFELSCLDIAQPQFPKIFQNIMTQSEISDNYDCSYLSKFHHNYIEQQANLQWFNSVHFWQETGQIDQYIMSHSGIQAQLIRKIFDQCFFEQGNWPDPSTWSAYYYTVRDPSWPHCFTVQNIGQLPEHIQNELKIKPKIYLSQNWRQMSLTDINHLYHTEILGSKA